MNLIPWRNKQKEENVSERELAPRLRRFQTEMDRMFDRFFQNPLGALSEGFSDWGSWGPSLDMSETDKHVIIKAELPGVDPKDVDITISGNTLTIAGEKTKTEESRGVSFFHSERCFGSFRRVVQLPTFVDAEKVSASHANGVVTIQLDKVPSATPKRIEVTAQ